jgi:hypothetical protein
MLSQNQKKENQMSKIRIREVTDSDEGDQLVFITDDGQRFNLQDELQKRKLIELLETEKKNKE